MAFDQKADTEEQREDVEGGDYFRKVLVDLDREVRQEVDEEEVAGKRHEVELDSVGWVSEQQGPNVSLRYLQHPPGHISCWGYWAKKDFWGDNEGKVAPEEEYCLRKTNVWGFNDDSITTASHEKVFPGLKRLFGDQTLWWNIVVETKSRERHQNLWGLPRETKYCVIPVKNTIIRGGKSLYLKKSNILENTETAKQITFHKGRGL